MRLDGPGGDGAGSGYAVFLSYHSQDHVAAEALARALRDRRLEPFLDRWYLTGGRPWVGVLEEALRRCQAVAVLVGPQGLGRWQQRERDLALNRQARTPGSGFSVIPVLLPGAEPPLDFLALNMWVDLRQGTGETELELLATAIRGEPPGPDLRARIAATWAAVCPYRGLRPFREEDAGFFCGREAFTETLIGKVEGEGRGLVAVVGASGSGKSSVVRAGLVPALRKLSDAEGRRRVVWEVVTMRPGEEPLRSLAAALMPLLEQEFSEVDRRNEGNKLAGYWAAGTTRLSESVGDALAKQPGTERLLLVVDQWEELYTLCEEEEQRRRFTEELLAATERGPLSVVLTLRGDFYGRALGDRSLTDRLAGGHVPLGPMTREELRRAIEEPAGKVKLEFEDGLVGRILDDVGDEPGNLPLLEFVLEMLWEQRRGGVMHHAAYEAIHGVQGAIAKRADEEYGKLSPEQRDVARRALVKLVRPGEGTADTRRRALLQDLGAEAVFVLERLVEARLLVKGRDPTNGDEVVEVTHEALIQRWGELRGWVDHDREFLRTRERIEGDAERWAASGRDRTLLLPAGRRLAEGEELLEQRRADLSPAVIGYIEASIAANVARVEAERSAERQRQESLEQAAAKNEAERQRAQAEAARDREASATRLAQRTLVGLTAAMVLLLVAGWQWWEAGTAAQEAAERATEADEARGEAETAKQEAQLQESRAVAILARQATDRGDAMTGMLAALAVLPDPEAGRSRPMSPEAVAILAEAWLQNHEIAYLAGHEGPVNSAAFSADGQRVVTASDDGTARVWDLSGQQPVATVLAGHAGRVTSAAFSADGQRVVSGSADRTARVWDLSGPQPVATVLAGHEGWVWSVAFSADGQRVVTVSDDGTARVWDLSGPEPVAILLAGHAAQVRSAAFSTDGQRVVTGSDDDTARVWDLSGPQPLATVLAGHEGSVWSATFSPDGQRVVTGSSDRTARVWDLSGPQPVATVLAGHTDRVRSAAFSADGRRVVTGSDDGTARVWDLSGPQPVATVLAGHEGAVLSAAISADGQRVVTGSSVGTARVWDLSGLQPVATVLAGHEGPVLSAAFRADGERVVTGSADGTARVWDLSGPQRFATVLAGHTGWVNSAAISADGHRVVTGSADGMARVWDLSGPQPVATVLAGHEDGVNSAAFSADGQRVVTGSSDGTARVWDLSGTQPVATVLAGHTDQVRSAAFSADGRRVVTGSDDGTARVWDLSGPQPVATVLAGHTDTVMSAAFSADGQRVVTGSWDGTARVWDLSGPQLVATLLAGHEEPVNSAAFSADGQWVVTGSWDGARMWDLSGPEPVATALAGHKGDVLSAAFSADGQRVVTGSDDGTARVWDLSGPQPVATVLAGHEDGVNSAAFSADGQRLVTGSYDGTAIVWPILPPLELIEAAKHSATRALTTEQERSFGLSSTP